MTRLAIVLDPGEDDPMWNDSGAVFARFDPSIWTYPESACGNPVPQLILDDCEPSDMNTVGQLVALAKAVCKDVRPAVSGRMSSVEVDVKAIEKLHAFLREIGEM